MFEPTSKQLESILSGKHPIGVSLQTQTKLNRAVKDGLGAVVDTANMKELLDDRYSIVWQITGAVAGQIWTETKTQEIRQLKTMIEKHAERAALAKAEAIRSHGANRDQWGMATRQLVEDAELTQDLAEENGLLVRTYQAAADTLNNLWPKYNVIAAALAKALEPIAAEEKAQRDAFNAAIAKNGLDNKYELTEQKQRQLHLHYIETPENVEKLHEMISQIGADETFLEHLPQDVQDYQREQLQRRQAAMETKADRQRMMQHLLLFKMIATLAEATDDLRASAVIGASKVLQAKVDPNDPESDTVLGNFLAQERPLSSTLRGQRVLLKEYVDVVSEINQTKQNIQRAQQKYDQNTQVIQALNNPVFSVTSDRPEALLEQLDALYAVPGRSGEKNSVVFENRLKAKLREMSSADREAFASSLSQVEGKTEDQLNAIGIAGDLVESFSHQQSFRAGMRSQ